MVNQAHQTGRWKQTEIVVYCWFNPILVAKCCFFSANSFVSSLLIFNVRRMSGIFQCPLSCKQLFLFVSNALSGSLDSRWYPTVLHTSAQQVNTDSYRPNREADTDTLPGTDRH